MSLGPSYTAAKNTVRKLVKYGIRSEAKGPHRPRFYLATELVKIFEP